MKTQVKTILRRPLALAMAGAVCVLAAVALTSAATAAPLPPGNNGTLKIHEQGTPSGTEQNDPKVCVFNVEAFGLDPGQEGYLVFTVQGGDGPTGTPAGPFDFGPADADGFFASQYFTLEPGHYKVTLYGKPLPGGTLEDVKAESKVFKVTCVAVSPSPSVSPSESVSPSPSPSVSPSESVSPSPSVSPSESESPSPSVAPSSPPPPITDLPVTGLQVLLPMLGLSLLVFGIVLAIAARRRNIA